MENVIKDLLLILIGFCSCGLFMVYQDFKKDREQRRWEQWYRNRNKR